MPTERNILFRGKEIKSRKWIKGYVFKSNNKTYIRPIHSKKTVEIIPKTVGQYAGLNDRHNDMIYEGDIINVYHNKELLNVSYIYFDRGEYKCGLISGGFIDEVETLPEQYMKFGIEIVGNIFDDKTVG